MAIEIPIFADAPDLSLQVELDGITFTLGMRWNERDAAWYVSLLSAEEDPIVVGIKVVLDYPLFSRFQDSRIPPGMVIAVDTSGRQLDVAEFEELGQRVKLLYFTAEELAG